MSDNEEIFASADDLDINLEGGDPLAPSISPSATPQNGPDPVQNDLLAQLQTLKEMATRIESQLHSSKEAPAEIPTETEQSMDSSETWAGPRPGADVPLPPLPPPNGRPAEPQARSEATADPFAAQPDPFAVAPDPFAGAPMPDLPSIPHPPAPAGPPSSPFGQPSPDPGPPAPAAPPSIPFPSAQPDHDPFASPTPPVHDPFGHPDPSPHNPFEQPPVDPRPQDPYGQPSPVPYPAAPDPYAPPVDPYPVAPDPYAPPAVDPYAPVAEQPAFDPFGQPDPYARPHPAVPDDPFGAPSAVPASDPYAHPASDPYARPVEDPYATAAPAHPSGGHLEPADPYSPAGLPNPYETAAPVAQGGYAPGGMMGSPLDQFLAQDVLAAISNHGGEGRVIELQQESALTRIRELSKDSRNKKGARTQHKTRGRGAPRFVRITTRFRPGDPLIIAITSPKGGVGKSTTAANLAAYYAKAAAISKEDVRVLLVDGDVANGNLALRVAQRLEPNMLDLLNHMDEVRSSGANLDVYERDMAPFVLGHPNIPNLDILAAPDNPDVLEQIEQEDLEYLRDTFSQFYQIVVFDTGTQIVEHTNCAWLNFSSQVYLMVEPEIACLQVTAEYAKRARRLQLITPQVCRLVMIRADMELENLDPKKVAQDVFGFIPPDRAFFIPDFHRDAIETGNAGEFLVLDSAGYADALTPIIKSSLESYEQGN